MRKKDYYSNSKDYINRWVFSYADFTTMLLALFMVLFAISKMDNSELKNFDKAVKNQFGITQIKENSENKNLYQNKQRIEDILATEDVKYKQDPVSQKNPEEILLSENDDQLFKIVKEKFKDNKFIEIMKEKKGTVIRLNDTILFDSGSAIIKSDAKTILNEVAYFLKDINNPIIIEGHTDSNPIFTEKYASNWELSTARATNIIKYFTQEFNFNPKRLSALGYGEYAPIADNTSFKGREKNRRVDIIILSKNNQE